MSKTITNKPTEIKVNNESLDRNNLFKLVTNFPSEKGIAVSEMRLRMRILDAIEKANGGNLELEDNDFNTLKTLFNNFGWVQPHKDILEMADHLEEVSKQTTTK